MQAMSVRGKADIAKEHDHSADSAENTYANIGHIAGAKVASSYHSFARLNKFARGCLLVHKGGSSEIPPTLARADLFLSGSVMMYSPFATAISARITQ